MQTNRCSIKVTKNGFACEAVSEVVYHSFEDKAFTKLIAEAQSANTSSCALLKRLGFMK
ncbi:GNAT family N-acetyltransferase [Paenibacillus sp. 5J-6]|uniref:GNAT family N-acetyltransferase n=1 Tax=Paenibacillus silvestris TaxID=2606219 RepID=A0A6L8UYK2_9BACL|nr:GNAT family N-acetyltransferase [Paenibacillus silvestris]